MQMQLLVERARAAELLEQLPREVPGQMTFEDVWLHAPCENCAGTRFAPGERVDECQDCGMERGTVVPLIEEVDDDRR